jgi:ABC-type multidrug transport system permease subunit
VSETVRPVGLVILSILVGLEALGVSIYALWFGSQLFVARTDTLAGALFLLVLFVLMAIWLWSLANGLYRMRTWARAGTLVYQTIQIVVGGSMITAEGDWIFVAVAMIILGLVAGVLLFSPRVVAVLARSRA